MKADAATNDSAPSDAIRSPEDRFFKAVFGRPDLCRDALTTLVPALGRWLAGAALHREPEHFVDAHLREKITDLLFSIRIAGRTVCPYLLFEHRSRPSPLTPLDVVRYQVQIWDWWVKTHPQEAGQRVLPIIIPIVVYSGPRAWRFSTEFADLTGILEGLEDHTLRFKHLLLDLSRVDPESVRKKLWLRMVCGLLRAVARGEVRDWFKEAGPYWDELLNQKNLAGLVETMLRYCVEADAGRSFSTIQELAANVTSRKAKGHIMSLAEKLIQQGRQEGLNAGVEVGSLIGRIQTYQDLLNEPASTPDELLKLKLAGLRKLARRLQDRLHRQR